MRIGILHIPTLDQDTSGVIRQLLTDSLTQLFIQEESTIADQRYVIEEMLRIWADERELDLILTIGATLPAPGPSGEESAPLATASVLERTLPGIAEAMRSYAQEQSELALLDCSIAGIRGRTIIVNLPAGAAPAHLFLEAVVDLISPLVSHLRKDVASQRLVDFLTLDALDEPEIDDSSSGLHQPTEEMMAEGLERSHKLDEAEFQEFLVRQKSNKSSAS